jgi:uroporphyrin-3 C-methyltransferase
MTLRDKPASDSRIPLVSGAVIAVRSRPYLAYLLALLALGVGAGAVWKVMDEAALVQRDHEKLVRLEMQLTDQRRQQQRLVDDLMLKSRQLDDVSARLARLDDTLNAEQRHVWLLSEADHYLRLAQQHLLLTRDIVGARTLLDVADRLLAAHGDNRLLPLRQALARDRLALTAAANVDVPGLYLRLGAFSERVAGLQLPAESGGRAQQRGGIVAPPQSQPNDALEAGWARLRGLVTIRRYDEPIRPLLGDADRALVRESLRLDLAQAQLALLRAEPEIFKSSLASARGRLTRYYSQLPKAEYEGLLKELAALADVDIRPALPDLSNSIGALDALNARNSRAPAALPGAAP